jgi:hypothetical protein
MQERERATAIERERCAKIAETPDRGRSWVPGSLWETLAREQSAAIRSQTL